MMDKGKGRLSKLFVQTESVMAVDTDLPFIKTAPIDAEDGIVGTRTWVVEELQCGDVTARHEFDNEPEALAKLAELRAAHLGRH
jgi:hypothetical protein